MELTTTQKLLIYGLSQFPVTKENQKAMFLFLYEDEAKMREMISFLAMNNGRLTEQEIMTELTHILKPDRPMGSPKKKAIIMMGIQGSGKSTFCQRYLGEICRVNLDTLKTRNNEKRLIEQCHTEGMDYVVDNTNPTREDRIRYIPDAHEAGYDVIGFYMQSKLQECIQRNEGRQGKERIPNTAIAMTSNRFELPRYAEGFDELYYVANDGTEMKISKWRDDDEL